MPVWLAVALGGATGSLARYALGQWLKVAVPAFPLATLAVNSLGGFAIGWLFAVSADQPPWLRLGLMTGVMGGFTTFSAFSLETLLLWQEGRAWVALLNVGLNLALALGGCALGLWLGRSG